jgi:hypothetical protein
MVVHLYLKHEVTFVEGNDSIDNSTHSRDFASENVIERGCDS